MTGATIPYNPLNDNILLSLLMLDILGIAYTLLSCGSSIVECTKKMFYYKKYSNPYKQRTHINGFCNIILLLHVILCMCILTYKYTKGFHRNLSENYSIGVTGAYAALFTLYMIIKLIMYEIINHTLFSAQQAKEWRLSYFFTIKLCGLLVTPAAITIILIHDIPALFYWIYIGIILLIYLIMLFIGCINIIFTEKRYYLDIFLYLCAIELMPLAFLWHAIDETSNFLTIKI